MRSFTDYIINLRELSIGLHSFEFILDDSFFSLFEDSMVSKGNLTAKVDVSVGKQIDIDLNVVGFVSVPCDRCLDDMILKINGVDSFSVQMYDEKLDFVDQDVVEVDDVHGNFNIAWILYETIVLNIPMQHVHEDGGCNEEMFEKLRHYIVQDEKDEMVNEVISDKVESGEVQEIDPRWAKLKDLLK